MNPIPRRALLAVLCLLLGHLAVGAASAESAPVAVDARSERIAALVERLESARQEHHIPGMAIAVVLDGEVVLARGFGFADVENEIPATETTLFAVGSTTKAFTSALAAMLVDRGKMSWDDPVTRHLPYFDLPVRGASDGEVPTIRDLLAHRTGFARMSLLWAGAAVPTRTVLQTAVGAEPVDDLRARFHYNNVMYLAAGEAIARAGRGSWAKQLDRRLFGPLGMNDANTSYDAARRDERMALGYDWIEDEGRFERRPMRDLASIAPAGAINAHVVDMAKWVRFQLDRGRVGERRLVTEDALAETWSPQIAIGDGVDYGLGWMLRTWEGRKVVEHGGNIDGFAAQVALLPEENLGFVLLANVSATPLAQASLPMVWEAFLGEPGADAVAEESLDRYVGEYVADFGPFDDAIFTVSLTDGVLAVDVPGQMNYKLKPPGEDGRRPFQITDTVAVSFDEDDDGNVVSLRMHQGGFDFDCPRKGLEIEPPVPLDRLTGYLGRYDREEGDGHVEVLVKNNRLAVDVPDQLALELDPPDDDGRWVVRIRPSMSMVFDRDEEGRVVAMTEYRDGEPGTRLVKVSGPDEAAGEPVALPTVEDLAKLCGFEERRAAYEAGAPYRITARLKVPSAGIDGTATTVADDGVRQRAEQRFGKFGHQVTVLDEDYAASESSFSPSRRLYGKEMRIAHMDHLSRGFTDWRRNFDEVEVVGEGEVDGRKTWRVRLTVEDTPPSVIDVDAETGDIVAAEVPLPVAGGAVTMTLEVRYEDFREAGGLRLPHRTVLEVPQSGRIVSEIVKVETGVEVEPGMFRVELGW